MSWILADDGAIRRVDGPRIGGLTFWNDRFVAANDLGAADGEIVVEQRHSFVPTLAENAVFHGDRPGETIEEVVTATRENGTPHDDAAARCVVDIHAILVIGSGGCALAIIGKNALNVAVFDEQGAAVFQLRSGDHAFDQRTLDRQVACAAAVDCLRRPIRDRAVEQRNCGAGQAQHRSATGMADARGVPGVIEQGVIERGGLRVAERDLTPAIGPVKCADGDRGRERPLRVECPVHHEARAGAASRRGVAVEQNVRAGGDVKNGAGRNCNIAGYMNDPVPCGRAGGQRPADIGYGRCAPERLIALLVLNPDAEAINEKLPESAEGATPSRRQSKLKSTL